MNESPQPVVSTALTCAADTRCQRPFSITTDPDAFNDVVKALEEKGYEILSDDLAMVPMTTTRLTDPDQLKQMGKLLDSLEDNDDVQNVWHSLENEEDLPE